MGAAMTTDAAARQNGSVTLPPTLIIPQTDNMREIGESLLEQLAPYPLSREAKFNIVRAIQLQMFGVMQPGLARMWGPDRTPEEA